MIRLFYSFVGIVLSPLVRLWLLRRVVQGKELRARLNERLGYIRIARPEGTLVWLHAASVGEAQSVLTLAQAMLDAHAAVTLLITTGTVTSARMVAAQALPRTIHQFVPVDTYFAVHRFLRHWQPNVALWVESEFWPQLLWQLRDRHIPTLLINARISERTASNWRRWPRTIRSIMAVFSAIYAGSATDAERLRALGATHVHTVGNLKYDAAPLPVDDIALAQMKHAISRRPVWLAASTHDDEELRIAAVHASLAAAFPDILTIIVPRHATRGDAIAAMLRDRGVSISRRSKHEGLGDSTGIYLADTMGELGLFYRLCKVVFIGGSLVAHGGHNPLEPARLGCAIITGPHTHNFAEMVMALNAAGAIATVQNETELLQTVAALLRDEKRCKTLAENARELVESARGASAVILQHIDQLVRSA